MPISFRYAHAMKHPQALDKVAEVAATVLKRKRVLSLSLLMSSSKKVNFKLDIYCRVYNTIE